MSLLKLIHIALLLLVLPLMSGVVGATTSFGFSSTPQSFVGQGQTVNITPDDGYQMGVQIEQNNTIDFYAIGYNSFYNPWRDLLPPGFQPNPTDPNTWWIVSVAIGSAQLPFPGEFVDPPGLPQSAQPIIDFTGNFRADDQTSGTFNIRQLEIDSGVIAAYALDFVHFGEDNINSRDVGYVRYNSAIPVSIPEPPVTFLLLTGLLAMTFCARTYKSR